MFGDHPRIRGEHRQSGRSRRSPAGSSPHTRGARVPEFQAGGGARIIPAYAGSTAISVWAVLTASDHPRIRGEHALRATETGPLLGSSPHTRGALRVLDGLAFEQGIIPAYAGSTTTKLPRECMRSDHPRIRGEHSASWLAAVPPFGSSPHTRGAPSLPRGISIRRRIIPAYAGSTGVVLLRVASLSDHPRIRGEHSVPLAPPRALPGSSPHTRGAPSVFPPLSRAWRIIPAYAGSTS